MKNKFVCILKSGGDYHPKEVINLYNQCVEFLPNMDEFICYSDLKFSYKDIIVKPLIGGLPGRWSMQEAFRETGNVMVTGLDTLMLKDMSWLFDLDIKENEFYGMHSFKKHRKWANSPMRWKGDWRKLYYDFDNTPNNNPFKLEQRFTAFKLEEIGAEFCYLDDEGLKIASYKRHICKDWDSLPDKDIIIFHGNPRPQHITKEPIKSLYRKFNDNE